MLLQLNRRSNQKGFTLVELLIVVAIIGVLSTIGVPTFRRMIQKSKKSEAKVNLGGIYTAEAAFQSEYNTFGNHLARMGYEMDGSNPTTGVNANSIYRVGFFTGACAAVAVAQPAAATPAGTVVNTQYPAYYNLAANSFFVAGNGNIAAVGANPLSGACYAPAAVAANPGPAGSVGLAAGLVNVATDGLAFTAAASGVITSDRIVGATAAGKDVWTITQARVLQNTNDGTR
jgi:type IV pilus assembly protein PilA